MDVIEVLIGIGVINVLVTVWYGIRFIAFSLSNIGIEEIEYDDK